MRTTIRIVTFAVATMLAATTLAVVAPAALAAKAKAVGTGGFHTCAITPSGALKCWGLNSSGQLGDGTFSASNVPVQVDGLNTGVKQVSAGYSYTCAVKKQGTALCWGSNNLGQLGIGTTGGQQELPVEVTNLKKVKAISAGTTHTCAIETTGTTKCWGYNSHGQLGNGSTSPKNTPVKVKKLQKAKSVATGEFHTCAIDKKDVAKCWGSNSLGQLAYYPGGDFKATPVNVKGLQKAKAITTGNTHACAVTKKNELMCWGSNSYRQLGDGTKVNRYSPTKVKGLKKVTAISARTNHTCAIDTKGVTRCWGYGANGEMGDGAKKDRKKPAKVKKLKKAKSVSTGAMHNCALEKSGTLKCWGLGTSGQLGNGSNDSSTTPVKVLL